MCGRFNLMATGEAIVEHFHLRRLLKYQPDYNIPPGQKILTVVALDDGSHKGVNLHWGLIPSWSKDRKIANRLINARAETLTEKPSFRGAYRKRRCLIPATGFFEWKQIGTRKQPYHIHYPDNHLLAFAGLWEYWEGDNETIYSCAIITTAAEAFMKSIHHRMPAIITPDYYSAWLDKSTPTIDLLGSAQTAAYDGLIPTPISNRINNPIHNDEACLRPIRSQPD